MTWLKGYNPLVEDDNQTKSLFHFFKNKEQNVGLRLLVPFI